MTYLEKKEKEKHLLFLIERKMLVSLEHVASDYRCSKKTIKRMIANLRLQGHDIVYCRAKRKYCMKK
ncbi:hypothetical protein [Flavisericum labens]|uniref:hypothetical protein n=1 Tax=Flavisericum labens TaxID=3377112 RepID=UPI00387AEC19